VRGVDWKALEATKWSPWWRCRLRVWFLGPKFPERLWHIRECRGCWDGDAVFEGPEGPGAIMCFCHRCKVWYYG
jgi:hypothetical protein